ncbi:MAG: DNA polymerase III subunit alpha [Defluviicoccus sp.]
MAEEKGAAAQDTTAPGFVHLRLHTSYSLSEGAIRIKELGQLCRTHGMPAVAITDTNNIFGGLEFSSVMAEFGIQPIVGCQLGITRPDAEGRGLTGHDHARSDPSPVVVLVQNERGYRSLLALIDALYRDADAHTAPQIAFETLLEANEGLIVLTGGAAGPIGQLLFEGRREAAEAALVRLQAAFPDRLYVEIMRHGLEIEAATEAGFLDLAERHGLPIVATNEVFFPDTEMYEAHDALMCIAQGVAMTQLERRRLTPEHFFKSAAEMRDLFSDLPDAVANALLIAKRCAFTLESVKPMLPAFDCGAGVTEAGRLREDAGQGLARRLAAIASAVSGGEANAPTAPYRQRLAYELDVICQMGFAGYFLIVSEFIGWAKVHGIPVGPGRGSGAGSLVAWALGITDLDPIRFGLLFERFLNPERVSMPDFDIDFCQDRRDEVIAHVQEMYGRDRVAQIITFGKLQARAVLRDVGRVLGMPYGYVDKICKLVPNNPAHPLTLAEAIAAEPRLQAMADADETVKRLIDVAKRLEGLNRHASTHAAGIVIGVRPLKELIPVYRDPRSEMLVTGFNMKWVEAAGLVKFDFLGLKTLTVLAKAVELIRRSRGIALALDALPLDDRATFEMLGRGETVGVFQLESSGMRDVLRKLRPDTLEDIIAVVALYRPGPMDNIPSYIRRKHGEEKPEYLHETLIGALKETHGIIIYQEQVMQIAQVLSGYSLGNADLLRRAMGKKNQQEMDRQREAFISGAKARGVSEGKASHIFDLVAKFAGYGFNKSHAAAYALIAYQTAYLKANYALEFFAASMTLDLGNSDKLNICRQELNRHGIALLPPDINASEADFTVEAAAAAGSGPSSGPGAAPGAVRYGLAAVKNVGQGTIAAIVEARATGVRFLSVDDFVARVHDRHLNKRQLENLVRSGAFDGLDPNRRRLFEGADVLMRAAGTAADARASRQMGLFGSDPAANVLSLSLPDVEDWPPMERLRQELEAVGFYLSAHPLDAYGQRLKRLQVVPFAELVGQRRQGMLMLAGTVVAKTERTSGKGNRYAFVQLSDATGVFEITVFADLLATCRDLLEVGKSLLIKANVQQEGETVRGIAQAVDPLDAVILRMPATIEITVSSAAPIEGIRRILREQAGGRSRVRLVYWLEADTEVEIALADTFTLDPALPLRLKALAGVEDVQEV